jgi:hypothetical protein
MIQSLEAIVAMKNQVKVVQTVKLINEMKTMVLDHSVLTFLGGLIEKKLVLYNQAALLPYSLCSVYPGHNRRLAHLYVWVTVKIK